MKTNREPYSPAQASQKLSDLRLAALRFQKEEFEKIFTAAVQLKLPFDANTAR